MNSNNKLGRDRYRKGSDRRGSEERKPILEQSATRQKRWKDMYETGELEAEDVRLNGEYDVDLDDDDDENDPKAK